jgi:hypothetical protein
MCEVHFTACCIARSLFQFLSNERAEFKQTSQLFASYLLSTNSKPEYRNRQRVIHRFFYIGCIYGANSTDSYSTCL